MLKVFLVDDEIRVLNHLKLAVNWNDLGLTVSGYASNGLEALELLKKDPPDILITDIRMPGINGLELCRRLRETNPEMIALYNEFNSQGLEIISISLDSDKSEWLEALKKTVYYGLITVPN